MNEVFSNKDITNIKIYLSKRINNESFWYDSEFHLISVNELNEIDRYYLYNKYCSDYLLKKFPFLSTNDECKQLILEFIDLAIIKMYYVKYNKVVLKSELSTDWLRQGFKGIEHYPYMKGIKYKIISKESAAPVNFFEAKATEKQLKLLISLLNKKSFLKFDLTKKNELTMDECSKIINYLDGKSDYIDGNIISKYFTSLYKDSLFLFIENLTVRESIKESIFNFLLENDFFYNSNELISQDEANKLDRIGLAHEYFTFFKNKLSNIVENKHKSTFILDAAKYIDTSIPKVYYIIYNNLYNGEFVSDEELDEFNPLDYEYTLNLEYQIANYKSTQIDATAYATVKQIQFIYLLLEKNNLSLILRDHRKLTNRDASKIISLLKENRLTTEYKEKYFSDR